MQFIRQLQRRSEQKFRQIFSQSEPPLKTILKMIKDNVIHFAVITLSEPYSPSTIYGVLLFESFENKTLTGILRFFPTKEGAVKFYVESFLPTSLISTNTGQDVSETNVFTYLNLLQCYYLIDIPDLVSKASKVLLKEFPTIRSIQSIKKPIEFKYTSTFSNDVLPPTKEPLKTFLESVKYEIGQFRQQQQQQQQQQHEIRKKKQRQQQKKVEEQHEISRRERIFQDAFKMQSGEYVDFIQRQPNTPLNDFDILVLKQVKILKSYFHVLDDNNIWLYLMNLHNCRVYIGPYDIRNIKLIQDLVVFLYLFTKNVEITKIIFTKFIPRIFKGKNIKFISSSSQQVTDSPITQSILQQSFPHTAESVTTFKSSIKNTIQKCFQNLKKEGSLF